MAHPEIVAKSFIAARLDTEALNAADLPGVAGRVYPDTIDSTEDNAYPAITFQVIGRQRAVGSFRDVHKQYPMDILIKVVGKDQPDVDLAATYDLIRAALDKARGFVGPDEVITFDEYQPHSLPYEDPQTGVKYPELGGFYHVVVELH